MSIVSERGYAIRRAWSMIGDAPFAFVLAVALSAAALALPMSIVSVTVALAPAASAVRPAPEVSLFVAPNATRREVEDLKLRLENTADVAAVRLIPRDIALSELAKRAGTALMPDDLAANPLPDVLVAQLTPGVAASRLEAIAGDTRRWPHVDSVRADTDWYRKLAAIARVGATVAVGLGAVVAVLVSLIVIGTVRLHATTRATEIEVLRLSGATTGFIVRPYAYSAAAALALAAAVAAAVVVALHAALAPPVAAVARLYGQPDFHLAYPAAEVLGGVVAAAAILGGLIGQLGARAAIHGKK
jgi:cell division transport system permease protein